MPSRARLQGAHSRGGGSCACGAAPSANHPYPPRSNRGPLGSAWTASPEGADGRAPGASAAASVGSDSRVDRPRKQFLRRPTLVPAWNSCATASGCRMTSIAGRRFAPAGACPRMRSGSVAWPGWSRSRISRAWSGRAAAAAGSTAPNLRVSIFGTGSQQAALQRPHSVTLGAEGVVTLHGLRRRDAGDDERVRLLRAHVVRTRDCR